MQKTKIKNKTIFTKLKQTKNLTLTTLKDLKQTVMSKSA